MNECIRLVNNSLERILLSIDLIKSEEIRERMKELVVEERKIIETVFNKCTVD